jgi:hypothetical protein
MDIRGRPFEPGNKLGKGRPRGSKNKIKPNARKLLAEYSESLMRKGILGALKGDDPRMLKGLIDQTLRLERDMPVRIGKISVDTPTEMKESFDRITKLLGAGKIDAEGALGIAKVLELALQAVLARDLDQRMKALEANEKLQDVGGQAGAGGSFAGCEDQPADPKPS